MEAGTMEYLGETELLQYSVKEWRMEKAGSNLVKAVFKVHFHFHTFAFTLSHFHTFTLSLSYFHTFTLSLSYFHFHTFTFTLSLIFLNPVCLETVGSEESSFYLLPEGIPQAISR